MKSIAKHWGDNDFSRSVKQAEIAAPNSSHTLTRDLRRLGNNQFSTYASRSGLLLAFQSTMRGADSRRSHEERNEAIPRIVPALQK